ncbi:MAG: hypothetical protein KDA28_16315 [Phycisphaerales bacterium]|nr:hypothetical protein [Phycisphaerales bacterium]
MHVLTILALAALPLVPGFGDSIDTNSMVTITTTSPDENDVSQNAAVVGTVYVISPWGWGAWYCVHHGYNRLVCPGTGLLFTYFHPGYEAEPF